MISHTLVVPKRPYSESEDVISLFQACDHDFIILCDGAGGYGNGLEAAKKAIDVIRFNIEKNINSEVNIKELIQNSMTNACRELMSIGQSTAIVIAIKDNIGTCTSVGDSKAYLISDKTYSYELTQHQDKNRLGQYSLPKSYQFLINDFNYLVVGSDGLWNYSDYKKMVNSIYSMSPENALKETYKCATKHDAFDDFSMILTKLKN